MNLIYLPYWLLTRVWRLPKERLLKWYEKIEKMPRETLEQREAVVDQLRLLVFHLPNPPHSVWTMAREVAIQDRGDDGMISTQLAAVRAGIEAM